MAERDNTTITAQGEKTVAAAATPEALVSTSTPCKKVWIGAPYFHATGASHTVGEQNTGTALIGIGPTNNQSGGRTLTKANYTGFEIEINDAQDIIVEVGSNGDAVEYQIYDG